MSDKFISPVELLQEYLCDDPWKMLIACKLLNRTHNRQVKRVIWNFFEKWPTPECLLAANRDEIVTTIRSLGFYNRRTDQIVKFTQEFLVNSQDPMKLHGVGKYAQDSYKIFVLKQFDVVPTDKKLIEFLDWKKRAQKSH